jgi:hypothetical protein
VAAVNGLLGGPLMNTAASTHIEMLLRQARTHAGRMPGGYPRTPARYPGAAAHQTNKNVRARCRFRVGHFVAVLEAH